MDDEREDILCEVCAAWNDEDGLRKRIMPVWQRLVDETFTEILEETQVELLHDGHLEMDADLDWWSVLSLITGQELTFPKSSFSKLPRPAQFAIVNLVHKSRQSELALFGDGGARGPGIEDGMGMLIEKINVDHLQVAIQEKGLVVDGVAVREGPGMLLASMITESLEKGGVAGHPAHRFNALHDQLCREEGSICGSDVGHFTIRRKLIRRHFQVIGDANAPPQHNLFDNFQRQKANSAPPLCTWDTMGYSLGLHLDTGRRLLTLPRDVVLLETFVRAWRGRYGGEAAMRLRAACLLLVEIHGKEGNDVPITPHERSFQLLRSVVEANQNRVIATEDGLMVLGTSGVAWWIWPGEGAHGSKCILAPADPRVDNPLEEPEAILEPICLYESQQHLPLGDRIVSNLLGLLNDKQVGVRIHQVRSAINYVNRLRLRAVFQ